MPSPRRSIIAAALLAVTALVGSAAPALASTNPGTGVDTGDQSMPAFYRPPTSLPSTPGSVVRTQKMSAFYTVFPIAVPGTAYRVMYTSTTRTGKPIATTGTVLLPRAGWTGPGARPVIGYAPGTQGLADHCAPSYSAESGFEYEGASITTLLNAGYIVALTDYQGLGTVGSHTYIDRVATAHATLDVVRAAQHLTNLGVPAHGPVALMGYSQGGGGAAAAGELAASYAPDLDVRGVAAGAVPADLAAVARNLDGSPYSLFAAYAVAGLAASYRIWVPLYANADGLRYLNQAAQSCVTSVVLLGFRHFSDLLQNGESLDQLLAQQPFANIVAQNRIGNTAPGVPMLLYHSQFDDVIPYAVGTQLKTDWCGHGAQVDFASGVVPTHIGGMPEFLGYAGPFLDKIFHGQPVANDC